MNRISRWGTAGVLAGVLAVAGCSGGSDEYKTAEQLSKERPAVSDHDHDHDHHHHEAPHGGHLVMLGDHVAQVELVLNAETGELGAYILDGEAEKPLPLAQEELRVTITPHHEEHAEGEKKEAETEAEEAITLLLTDAKPAEEGKEPVAGIMYRGQSDKLKGLEHFDVVIEEIKVGDQSFSNTKAHYGGDHDHDHDHAH